MSKLGMVTTLACTLACVAAGAAAPVAVVEEVSGTPGVEFLDYVAPGQVIKLGPADTLVLGYLKSCWRETIRGGVVTVGNEQSEVAGGAVDRVKVACDGGKMELAAAQSKQGAAMVFRAPPTAKPANLSKPQFVLYGRAPVIDLPGGGTVSIERLDQPGERLEIAVAPDQLVHKQFYDLGKAGKMLAAGGLYRASSGKQQLVFQVDAAAKSEAPLAGRLLRFQPAS